MLRITRLIRSREGISLSAHKRTKFMLFLITLQDTSL